MLYRIKNWDKHFETYESKRLRRLAFVVIPNKHDGKSFRRLMRLPHGPALYGAWILIVQVASRCPTRGVLEDDDGPLTARDLADKTDCPENVFSEALSVLSQPAIGWLTCDESEDKSAGTPADPTVMPADHAGIPVLKGREGKGTEQKGSSSYGACSEPASLDSLPTVEPQDVHGVDSERPGRPAKPVDGEIVMTFPCKGRGASEWHLSDSKLAEYQQSFPDLDVLAQCRAIRQWCIDNGPKRKTAGGMPGMITRWLNRTQNDGRRATPHQGQSRRSGGTDNPALIRGSDEATGGTALKDPGSPGVSGNGQAGNAGPDCPF